MKNREDLSPKEERRFSRLGKMEECKALMEVHLFKERMRSIYSTAKTEFDAAILLDEWIADAAASAVPELKSVSKTFKAHRNGILGFWRHGGMSN